MKSHASQIIGNSTIYSTVCSLYYRKHPSPTLLAFVRGIHQWLVDLPPKIQQWHCSDVIMSAMASQITSLMFVYSTVYSGADQRKHQNSASLAFLMGIHRWPVNSPHKGPVTGIILPYDDVIMIVRSTNSKCCNLVGKFEEKLAYTIFH